MRSELERLGVRWLALFGSAAQGTLGPASVVDVLVELDGSARFNPFMDLKLLLEETLGRRVDVVTLGAHKPALRARITSGLLRVA